MDQAHARAHASSTGRASIAASYPRPSFTSGQARQRGSTSCTAKSHASTDISHLALRAVEAASGLPSIKVGFGGVPQIPPVTHALEESEEFRSDRAWQEGWSLVASFLGAGNDGDFHSW